MVITILDGSMKIQIDYDWMEPQYKDNIFMAFTEHCPKEQRVFDGGGIRLGLTPSEAEQLALALKTAVEKSRSASRRPRGRKP